MAEKKNYNISFLRILATLLLVFCHPLRHFEGIQALAKLSNLSPLIFLIISGYLYGRKSIDNPLQFLVGRLKKVFVPASVFSFFASVALILAGEAFSFRKLLGSVLNTYGFTFIFFSERSYGLFQYYDDLGYLWFVTVILFCYCIVLLLDRIKKVCSINSLVILALFTALIAADMVLIIRYEITIKYFIYFIIGYWLSGSGVIDKLSKQRYLACAVLISIFVIIRLVLKHSTYGSVFYKVISELSTGSIALLIFLSGFAVDLFIRNFTSVVSLSNFGGIINDNSYYIYICHGLFCLSGRFDVFSNSNSMIVSAVLFLTLLTLCTVALKYLMKFFKI